MGANNARSETAEITDGVEVYDFRRPVTLTRDQSRALELALETFARQWATQLTANIRAVSRVKLLEVAMVSYDDYVASLPASSVMVLCAIDGVEARAVVQLPPATVLGWIGRMLGGIGILPTPSRPFTPIEQKLVQRLLDDLFEDLSYSLGALFPHRLSVEAFHYNSQFAQAAATSDLMIVSRFDIRVGDSEATGTLSLPADSVLPQLGATLPLAPTESTGELLQTQLAAAPVDVSLRLAATSVEPGAILDLAIGDLIAVPHQQGRPLDVAVAGSPIGKASLASSGSRLAFVLTDIKEQS